MTEPVFWLACSFVLVAVCLAAVLMAAIPALQELARASRSAEKLFDTLYRELPPTLEAIRLTGLEISDLTDDLSEGVESAGKVAQQFDQGLRSAQRQVQGMGTTTQSVFVGVQAAWKTLMRPTSKSRAKSNKGRSSNAKSNRARQRPSARTRDRLTDSPSTTGRDRSPYDEPQWPTNADSTPETGSTLEAGSTPEAIAPDLAEDLLNPDPLPDE
ncbi:MAG: DUF948 domain-containing protein [Thermosynechococcaceae cyanobacterium MS004]|nr:DUF948 domain-containing protein [Thermosynechococcaceae cyanobacterium MS004]